MQPVNSKSMFHHLMITLEKLDSAEIDVATANATSKIIGQATNLLMYELKRAVVMSHEEWSKHHRNLELKVFDSLPE